MRFRLLLPLLCIHSMAAAQQSTVSLISQAQKQQIDQLVSSFMLAGKTTAVELAIQQNGKTVYECGYGTISAGSSIPPGPDTHFQIDSLTKVFTAFSILELAEQGKLDIDQPFSKYITALSPNWKGITIRQLLGMVSGIPDGGTMTGTYQQVLTVTAQKKTSYQTGLGFQPGSKYQYSNNNYFLLGQVVNAVSPQKNFAEYCEAAVLTPLRMQQTGFISWGSGDLWPTPTINGKAVKPRNPTSGFTGGGFSTTMSDLELFGAALFNRSILSASTYTDMWTRTVLTTGSNTGQSVVFGLGWDVAMSPQGGVACVSKNGGGYGWGSQLNFFPPSGLCVMVLRNSSGGGPMGPFAMKVAAAIQ